MKFKLSLLIFTLLWLVTEFFKSSLCRLLRNLTLPIKVVKNYKQRFENEYHHFTVMSKKGSDEPIEKSQKLRNQNKPPFFHQEIGQFTNHKSSELKINHHFQSGVEKFKLGQSICCQLIRWGITYSHTPIYG